LGFNLDPLVLVIPIFLTARALSHSVQSMDRYHEEFYRLKDKHQAIVVSYSHLFAPAIASIVTDGIGLLVVAVAPIPLIQKIAIFASFWVVSIFISVVTLHPIILTQSSARLRHSSRAASLRCRSGPVAPRRLVLTRHPFAWVPAFRLRTPVFAWYWLAYWK
jgi:predicted RND superfamily exporter protein